MNMIAIEYPDKPTEKYRGGEIFQYREFNGIYQVHSMRLQHWALCDTQSMAKVVCDALEEFYKNK
jgi:hypothetical protein